MITKSEHGAQRSVKFSGNRNSCVRQMFKNNISWMVEKEPVCLECLTEGSSSKKKKKKKGFFCAPLAFWFFAHSRREDEVSNFRGRNLPGNDLLLFSFLSVFLLSFSHFHTRRPSPTFFSSFRSPLSQPPNLTNTECNTPGNQASSWP